MNHILVIILSLSLAFLLIGSFLGNANMRALAQANNTNSSIPYTANHTILKGHQSMGPPQKVTIPLDSKQPPTLLSDAKKQQLINSTHLSPSLPLSGKPIQGPAPGTQISP